MQIMQCILKRKMSSFVWDIEHAGSVFWLLKHFAVLSCLCPEHDSFFLFVFLLLQVSVQPQKTSPTRSRTCGQSAARTLEGRTLSPVQMGRSQATVGECHIPARPAKPSVHCLIWSKQHQPQLSIPVTFTAATKLNHCFTSRQSSHIKLCVGLNIPCYSVWGITFGSYYLFNLTI